MAARRRPEPGATIPACPAARRSGGHHRGVTSLPQGPAQWRRRGRERSRAWRGPGERGSSETGPDGQAFSEGKKQWWRLSGHLHSSGARDEEVLLLKQFGHRRLQQKTAPGQHHSETPTGSSSA